MPEIMVRAKHDFDGGDAFVVLNSDLENNKYGVNVIMWTGEKPFVEIWDFATGNRYSADDRAYFDEGFLILDIDMMWAGETQCYVLRKEKDESLEKEPRLEDYSTTPMYDDLDVNFDEPNVCVLDFAKWRWEGSRLSYRRFWRESRAEKRRYYRKMPRKLAMKSFAEQNMPFYSGNVTYKLTSDVYNEKITVNDGERVFLSAKYHGAAVRVQVDGVIDEIIAWEPYEVDITEAIMQGKDIDVTILGTRKNTFGLLHVVPCVVHRCGHGSFTTEGDDWTDEYNLIKDGLREIRFTVKK